MESCVNRTDTSEAFFPWVGTEYGTSRKVFRQKVMILGESLYCEEHEGCGGCAPGAVNSCNYFLIHLVLRQLLGVQSLPLYTKLFKLFVGDREISKEAFWNSVAYSVFVQSSVGTGARQRPDRKLWADAAPVFWTTLRRLEPEKLVVFGDATWVNLPGVVGNEWEKTATYLGGRCCRYTCRVTPSPCDTLVIDHPQRPGFDYSEAPVVKEFLGT